ncbi:hypothetical protein FACS189438_0850 [Bacteroidia bacterium]|nr:hypothetical protein FACS189438_0850 [Bacteroidia bacterium]
MKTNRFPYGILAALGATAFFLASCEKEVDFTGQLPGPKIVLNSFVEPGAPITAAVSRSWNIAENNGPYPLAGAEVLLYINNILQPPMQPYVPPILPDGHPTGQPPAWTHVSPSAAGEGDIIRMVAKFTGYPEVSAETTVPGKATILSVDTVRFNEQGTPNHMRFLIKFKDLEAGKKNYYRLVLECEISDDNVHWILSSSSPYVNYNRDAALSEGFKDAAGELLGTGADNIYGLFTDNLFDGKEYTLNISFLPEYTGETDWTFDTGTGQLIPSGKLRYVRYLFKLVALSPSAYMYLKSRTFYDANGDGDIAAEPSAIYNNIQGGLGILGAFQTDTLRLHMPLNN